MKVLHSCLRVRSLEQTPSKSGVAAAGTELPVLRPVRRCHEGGTTKETRDFDADSWSDRSSSLRDHVGGVVSRGAEEEMGGVATQRSVARVADNQRSVDLDVVGQSVSHAMGVRGCSVVPELAVSVSSHCARPQPAAVAFLNTSPQAFVRVHALVVIATGLRAVLTDLRNEIGHHLSATSAWLRDFLCSDLPALCVAAVRAEGRHLTRSAHLNGVAYDANVFNPWRVISWHISRVSQEDACGFC